MNQLTSLPVKAWLTALFSLALLASTSGCGVLYIMMPSPEISYDAALGDLDGDGDLDAFLANGKNESVLPSTIWLNQGGRQGNTEGRFAVSGLRLGQFDSHSVELGDLDGDGDLDAALGVGGLMVFINQGGAQKGDPGDFQGFRRGFWLADSQDVTGIWSVALGDLDGDGDLDAATGVCCGGIAFFADDRREVLPSAALVWINDGIGEFEDSGQRLGTQGVSDIALGDLDGDGDLDAYAANSSSVADLEGNDEHNQPDLVWLNDGSGHFESSGQRLGQQESLAAALGDLDSDGDLDAFVAGRGPALVWLNDGRAFFTASDQRLGDLPARHVSLGDLDSDGDLDALLYNDQDAQIWLNDGDGGFQLSRQQLEMPEHHALALGDLDGDGDLDLFAGYVDERYDAWWNDGSGRLGKRWR
jgi:hypothetical protein